jgi:hypothetical protein
MKKLVKIFENLVNKTLFNIKGILFKYKSIINSKLEVSSLNKYIISFISLLFFYLFYLSIPNLYNKTWVQNTIENKLLEEFKINFSISSEISYNILPSPHFLIKNSKIFRPDDGKTNSLSEIKKLKIFISQKNFFNKEKMYIKNVLINDANFSFYEQDFNLLNKLNNKKLSDKKINIIKSNIFFKDNSDKTYSIVKISKAVLFSDKLELLNILDLTGEIFNLPFLFSLNQTIFSADVSEVIRKVNISSNKIKLKIFNESIIKLPDIISGLNNTSILNSKIATKYNINKNKNEITFTSSKSKVKDSSISYNGKLSTEPFDLSVDIDLSKIKLAKLLNNNSLFFELLKTQLFFNENLSADISLNTKFKKRDEVFNQAKFNFNIVNGTINFNQTKLINDKIGSLEIVNSLLYFDENKLILNSDIMIDIKNFNNLFSYLQTPKSKRSPIKKVYLNLNYDFSADQIFLNSFRVDDGNNENEIIKIINNFYRNKGNNTNVTRRMLNKLFSLYEG